MKILTMDQGTSEWFAVKRGVASSSRGKDITAKDRSGKKPGLTRASYMRELACEIITGVNDDGFMSKWMKRGTELEPAARAQFSLATGMKVTEVGFCFMEENGKNKPSYIGASTDGMVEKHAVLELKCPKETTHLSYLLDHDKLIKEYNKQVQFELMVTKRKMGYLASYHPDFPDGSDLLILEVKRDTKLIAEMRKETKLFVSQLHDMINQVDSNLLDKRQEELIIQNPVLLAA